MSEKSKTTIVFSAVAKALLLALAKKYGLTMTAALEMILRDRAKQEGLWQ